MFRLQILKLKQYSFTPIGILRNSMKNLLRRALVELAGIGVALMTFTLSIFGQTADEKLINSILKSDVKGLEEALKEGANPNFTDEEGNTVLAKAAMFGQSGIVKALLEKGADVNFQDQNGNTALMIACGNNNRLEVVKLLLEKKPDVYLKNKNGDTCLSISLSRGLRDISRMVIKSMPYLTVDTKLAIAAIRSNDEETYKLIQSQYEAGYENDKTLNKKVKSKLDRIIINKLEFQETLIPQVVIKLNSLGKELDPEMEGVRILLPLPKKEKTIPSVTLSASDISLGKAIEQLCQVSGFKYKIDLGAVVIYKEPVLDSKEKEDKEHQKKMSDRGSDLMPFEKNRKWGFVDISTGKITIKPQFDGTRWFMDGQCHVMLNGKWGIIDKTGKSITQHPSFKDNRHKDVTDLMPTKVGNKWGFTDETGKIVIQPQFDQPILPFHSGSLAAVTIDHKMGYIDRTGKMIIEPVFEQTWGFYIWGFYIDGYAPALSGGKWGLIDMTGQFIFEPQFDEIYIDSFSDENKLLKARLGRRYFKIDLSGRIVSPIYFIK